MRLASFRIHHYKRFEAQTTVDLGPSVIAVVGPNEAGKTSLLDALEHVNHSEGFGSDEFSDHIPPQADTIVVSARLALDSGDYAALEHIRGARQIRFYDVWKRANGEREHFVEPPLQRKARALPPLRRNLERALKNERLPELRVTASEDLRALADRLHRGLLELNAGDSASDELLASATTLASALDAADLVDSPKYVQELGSLIEAFVEEEGVDALTAAAMEILDQRAPNIVRLNPSEAALPSSWNYEEEASDALTNFLLLAGTSPEEVRAVAADADAARTRTAERAANERLRRALTRWEDGELSVEIHIGEGALDILPLDHSTNNFNKLENRSDGLRAYLALIAFVAQEDRETPPVLLVDEAETHLHYAAQAELVRVFHRQSAAAKIIYTTHSAGCLPEDLGTGVRFVEKIDRARSRVGNAYWASGVGFTPLLLAMGANALAFTPTRFAVIAEGPSDALLLPSMLREAAGLDQYATLGFQVAPGVASVRPRDVPGLDLEAARVTYLVDGDEAGADHAAKLEEAGIPAKRILHLGGKGSGLTLEDLLDSETYAEAVEYVATRANRTSKVERLRPLPAEGRSRFIDDWAERHGLSVGKTLVAQHLLELHRKSQRLTEAGRATILAQLREDITALFEPRRA